jgi:hypothetical protein
MEVTTIGLDIAKSVFQVHGVDANGKVIVSPPDKTSVCFGALSEAVAVSGRHRSLRLLASLVARAQGARP